VPLSKRPQHSHICTLMTRIGIHCSPLLGATTSWCRCSDVAVCVHVVFPQSAENLPTVFGSNGKAQVAAKTVFHLAHRHGDILREGWKNIVDSMLQLFRAELLPKAMVEVGTRALALILAWWRWGR